jgi:hypothetical protein
MTSPHEEGWRALSERLLRGERLSADEEAELALARERDAECAIELDLLEELATVLDRDDELTDPANVEIARAALGRAREATADDGGQSPGSPRPQPSPRSGGRPDPLHPTSRAK